MSRRISAKAGWMSPGVQTTPLSKMSSSQIGEAFASRQARKTLRSAKAAPPTRVAPQKQKIASPKQYAHRKPKRLHVNRAWVDAYKAESGCSSCGEKDAVVLDLHHRHGFTKKGNVSVMVHTSTLDAIIREVSKCIVICCNCHRREHHRIRSTPRQPHEQLSLPGGK